MEALSKEIRQAREEVHQMPMGYWILLGAYSLVGFGSPMPTNITWLEIVIGAGLIVGGLMLVRNVIAGMTQDWQGRSILGMGATLLVVPMTVAFFHDYATKDVMRDVIPLIFLLGTPVLLVYSKRVISRVGLRRLIVLALLMVGLVSAVTFWIRAADLYGSLEMAGSYMRRGLSLYLQGDSNITTPAIEISKEISVIDILGMYDPAVLFSCLFLCSWGVVLLVHSWRYCLPGSILLAAGAIIGYELMVLGLRSYALSIVVVVLIIAGTQLRKRGFYTRLLPLGMVSVVLFYPQIQGVVQLLWIKQLAVGTNGKYAEWEAVISTISSNPWNMFFGIGWGGMVDNPILSYPTRFTHSLLSFFLLKSGLVGLGVMLMTMVSLLFHGRSQSDSESLSVSRIIMLVSSLPPLLIGIFFEPSYKMHSYGVILALLILALPWVASQKKISV